MRLTPVRVGSLLTLPRAQVGDTTLLCPVESSRRVLATVEAIPKHRRFVVLAYQVGGAVVRECILTPNPGRIIQEDGAEARCGGWHYSEAGRRAMRKAQTARRKREGTARHG